MKISYLAVILVLLSVFSVSLVHAQVGIPISTSTSPSVSFLSGLSSGNSYIYAGFFSIVMFIIFAIALNRTQLSSGSIAISFIFALITFFLLYADAALLHFFLNTFIVLAFIALILGMLAAVKSPRSIRLIGLIVALFLIIILFENDSGLTNFVNSTFHVNILSILPLVFGLISVVVFIILLLRGVKTHSNIVLRVILLFIVFLLIALLIPGFAGFLFSPIVLIPLFAAILLIIFFVRRAGRHVPKPSREDKAAQREAKIQQKAQKRALKKEQNYLNDKNNFINNTGNSEAGDLFDLANAVKEGSAGPVPTGKAARKIFKRRISKEARNKNVTDLLNQRDKLLDPNLNLSDSTRSKQVAKIDKKLKKISPRIDLKARDKISQNNQLKQQMLEEQAKMAEAARQQAEQERMLKEQAKMAEAARQQAEQERMLKEQAKMAEAARQQADYDRMMKEKSYNIQNSKRDLDKIKKEDNDNLDRNPLKEMEQQIDEINEYLKQTERQGKKPSNLASDKNQSKMFIIPIFGKKNNGMFRRKVVGVTGKNADMSKEAGTDVSNAKVIAGSNMTQAETRMFEGFLP